MEQQQQFIEDTPKVENVDVAENLMLDIPPADIFTVPSTPQPGDNPIQTAPEIEPPATSFEPEPRADEETITDNGRMDKQSVYQARQLMEIRNMLQPMGISYYVNGTIDGYKEYKYSDSQLDMLADAWAPIIAEHALKVSPLQKVLIAEITCLTPVVVLATQNRQMRQKLESVMNENADLKQQIIQQSTEPQNRRNFKKYWEIDEQGYFRNTSSGVYIKASERKDKPNIENPEVVKRLINHNGVDVVKQVFNISL